MGFISESVFFFYRFVSPDELCMLHYYDVPMPGERLFLARVHNVYNNKNKIIFSYMKGFFYYFFFLFFFPTARPGDVCLNVVYPTRTQTLLSFLFLKKKPKVNPREFKKKIRMLNDNCQFDGPTNSTREKRGQPKSSAYKRHSSFFFFLLFFNFSKDKNILKILSERHGCTAPNPSHLLYGSQELYRFLYRFTCNIFPSLSNNVYHGFRDEQRIYDGFARNPTIRLL